MKTGLCFFPMQPPNLMAHGHNLAGVTCDKSADAYDFPSSISRFGVIFQE
jgi:hypothetical protein